MTSTTYRKLTYEELRNLAYDFLNEYTDGQLPINLVSIIDKINNLHLLKYTTFAKQHNLSMSEVIAFLQSDDGALWYQYSTDTYILLYNDTIASKERIRFTIAHELGHYVLRHNEITDKTIISRYTLTNSEYNEFEREASFSPFSNTGRLYSIFSYSGHSIYSANFLCLIFSGYLCYRKLKKHAKYWISKN